MTYTETEIAIATEAEAQAWATFFNVTDDESIERRRNVMRANVAVGYFEPLEKYLVKATNTARNWK